MSDRACDLLKIGQLQPGVEINMKAFRSKRLANNISTPADLWETVRRLKIAATLNFALFIALLRIFKSASSITGPAIVKVNLDLARLLLKPL
ncbi:MAG: hypothetical protein ACLQAH_02965 [Limisphaerales bacterium]